MPSREPTPCATNDTRRCSATAGRALLFADKGIAIVTYVTVLLDIPKPTLYRWMRQGDPPYEVVVKKLVSLFLVVFLALASSSCQQDSSITATSIPPTATIQPPTPTATATSIPPTVTPLLTATPILPTQTPKAPTATPTVKPTPADLSLGDTWTRPADDMVMVYVPGGEFEMGTSDDQLKYSLQLCKKTYARIFGAVRPCATPATFADERPAHTVVLDGFWIDRLEVTNEQYRRCVEAGACTPPVESRFLYPRHVLWR